MENLLDKLKISVPKNYTKNDLMDIVDAYKDIDNIFSYIVFNKPEEYIVQFNVSQTEEYNTITSYSAIIDCVDIIVNNKSDKKVIGYKQPSVDLLIKLYEPLVTTLTNEQYNHWSSRFEYDDLKQMCYLSLVLLYRKKYYINKRVLRVTYNNYVLMELRKFKDAPEILSFSDLIVNQDENEHLTIEDTIPDTSDDEDRLRKEELELNKNIFAKMKDKIIELIGSRQYDQLYREYTTGNTTSIGRKNMQRIKQYLKTRNITRQSMLDKE